MQPETVAIQVANKDYMVACQPDEREAVRASAELLNSKIAEIRGRNKVLGAEQLAVLAALNIAHEMLKLNTRISQSEIEVSRLTALGRKIDSALERIGG
ncbi:MAG: cell division protein ZapA [Gammaproteobacteria bacterium]|nr:cell division protein ZapA [Gammaproteobacteria bacterium]